MSDARKTASNLQFTGHHSYTRKIQNAAKEGEMHDFLHRVLNYKALKHLESENTCFVLEPQFTRAIWKVRSMAS